MSAYRSWVGLALLFLCTAIGSHLIADFVSRSDGFQAPSVVIAQNNKTAPKAEIRITASDHATTDDHICPWSSSNAKQAGSAGQKMGPGDFSVLNQIVSAGNKIRARLRMHSICRNENTAGLSQVSALDEE